MKTKFFNPRIVAYRVAIVSIMLFFGWSCSSSQHIPDRLLGVDLEELEKILVRKIDRGDDKLTYRLAEVFFVRGNYREAYDAYQRADALGQLDNPKHRRNFVHAGKALGFATPYDQDTGYFDRNMVFPVRIHPFCGNSRNEDIVPYQWGEYLFVTSSRQQSGESYPVTGNPFLNVVAFVENCQAVSIPDFLPKGLNTDLHDGPLAISADGNLVIINRNYRRPNKENYRHLYFDYFVKDESGRWSDARRFPYSDVDHSVQHPFFKDDEQALYYSSDKPGGFGGFDLYKSVWNGSEWGTPVNLGSEINTVYDEVFPVFTPDGHLMYSSNHIETQGGLDFVLFKDGKRKLFPAPLNTVYDDFALTFSTDDSGYFASTRDMGVFADNIFRFSVYDPGCFDYVVKVRDKKTGAPLEGVVVRYNSLEASRRDQLVTLDGGRSSMFCHPEELKWPVDFQAEKQGYKPKSVSRGFEFLPDEGIYLAILELEGPVELFVEPAPHIASGNIVVFFENDIPRPAPAIPSYDVTFERYLSVRQDYLRLSASPRQEMERFFEKVDLGMSSLRDFAAYVYENIGDNNLEIFLRGHASPRSNPVYNLALSERRNQSIKNFLMAWNGGRLAPYFNSGMITISAIPFGDTQAAPGVSGSFQDRARSVYSVEASRERRVTLFWNWRNATGGTSHIPESIKELTLLTNDDAKPLTHAKDAVGGTEQGIYIIVGSFPNINPARNLLNDLIANGHSDAGILPANDVSTNRVYVKKYDSYEEARNELGSIRRSVNNEAWVLVK